MTSTAPVLTTDRLTKRYRNRVAVNDLTMEIPRGAVAGFIGPNGAGKTTTMAMLLGLVRPTSGDGVVLGESIHHPERYVSRVGVVLEAPALWPALTGMENLRVLARLGGHDERRIPSVLDLVGLGVRGHERFGKYSLGMKQRLSLAAALLGEPDLLILDEPTNGLDPAGMSDMRDLIARIASQDRTVLISSHILSELEQICDRLVIIESGRLIYSGRADEFASQSGNEVLLRPADPTDLRGLVDIVVAAGLEAGQDGDHLVVLVAHDDPARAAAALNHAAAAAGIVLVEVQVRRPSLEATYLRMVEGDVA